MRFGIPNTSQFTIVYCIIVHCSVTFCSIIVTYSLVSCDCECRDHYNIPICGCDVGKFSNIAAKSLLKCRDVKILLTSQLLLLPYVPTT